MPKQPYFESAIHTFLRAVRRFYIVETEGKPRLGKKWRTFISTFKFKSLPSNQIKVSWTYPTRKSTTIAFDASKLYFRGDMETFAARHHDMDMTFSEDKIKNQNDVIFNDLAMHVISKAGLKISQKTVSKLSNKEKERFMTEEEFHDQWAQSTSTQEVDPRQVNEMYTAPEMRYIHKILGPVKGKRILDVGSGLGEVGIYFAQKGARVTLTDISQGMLDFSQRLADRYKLKITTHKSTIENLALPKGTKFDIIYAGNLFHHVNIDQALGRLKTYLKKDGVIVSRDPLAYNPIINVYREIAVETRSKDEHPIIKEDLKLFRKHFKSVRTRFFWLTTLSIFIIMAVIQRRNPNRERYWKKVEEEGNRWARIYTPLERLDKYLLDRFPALRWYCWNVVIVCKNPR